MTDKAREALKPQEYYVRNKDAAFLGNSPVWWARDGRGYTAYVQGAHRFTEEEAKKMVMDNSDKWAAFKCSDVDARLHLVFDYQDVKNLGTDKPCGWDWGYAQNTRAAHPVDVEKVAEIVDEAVEATQDALGFINPDYSEIGRIKERAREQISALSVLPAEAAKGEAERKGWNEAIKAASNLMDKESRAEGLYNGDTVYSYDLTNGDKIRALAKKEV